MGYLPTNLNWNIVTINTPPSKRQQNSVVSERNAVGTLTNGKNEFYLIKQFLLTF
jgi:hypothetical protein